MEYVGEPLPLDFHVSLQCSTNDPHSLDEIAQNPVLGEDMYVCVCLSVCLSVTESWDMHVYY